MQITQAMKMVSAAKLKKAQSAIVSMRPYSENLFSIVTDILNSMPGFSSPLVGQKKAPKRLLISITSNRGLCGGFNSNIIKATNGKAINYERDIEIQADVFNYNKDLDTLRASNGIANYKSENLKIRKYIRIACLYR